MYLVNLFLGEFLGDFWEFFGELKGIKELKGVKTNASFLTHSYLPLNFRRKESLELWAVVLTPFFSLSLKGTSP